VAKSACRLALVDEKRFLFMVQQTPFFALHVMRVLATRLRWMNAAWRPNTAVPSPPASLRGAMASGRG
jgi:CRP/FNR family cyclic AMP-dependent transcriptional regulator